MATIDAEQQVNTMAAKLRGLGGAGIPEPLLSIFHEREVQARRLRDDTTRSDSYRQSESARIENEAEEKFWAARDEEIAAKRKPLEQERGRILAEIKGTETADRTLESAEAQRERHARAMHEALTTSTQVAAIQAMRDPADLKNLLDEALMAGRADRVRVLGPIVVAQVERLERSKVRGAAEVSMQVRIAYQDFKQKNPSAIERLRRVESNLGGVEAMVNQAYGTAREHFKLGRR